MPTRAQLALIHIAKKDLRLDDDTYRDILFVRFGKESARDLEPEEIAALLEHFRSLGWKPRTRWIHTDRRGEGQKTSGQGNPRPGMATPAQIRKIVAMWMTGKEVHQKTLEALRHFLGNRFHINDLRFIKARQVTGILAAIRRMSHPPLWH